MSHEPYDLEIASAEQARQSTDLPAGVEWAQPGDARKLKGGDAVLFQARLIDRLWVAARVLGGDDKHVKVLILDLPTQGMEIYMDIERDAVAAVLSEQ